MILEPKPHDTQTMLYNYLPDIYPPLYTFQLDLVSQALCDSGVPGAVKAPNLPQAATQGADARAEPIVLSDDEEMDVVEETRKFLKDAKALDEKKKAEAEAKAKKAEAERRRKAEAEKKEKEKKAKEREEMERQNRERRQERQKKEAAEARKREEDRKKDEEIRERGRQAEAQYAAQQRAEREAAAVADAVDGAGGLEEPMDQGGLRPPTIMDKVASAVQGKTHHRAAGTVIETSDFKQTWVHEQHTRDIEAPQLPEAQPQTVGSLMPEGERGELGGANGAAIANKKTNVNVVEFVMVIKVRDNSGAYQVQLPGAEIFEELAGKASWELMDEKAEYCLVVDSVAVNDAGIGLIGINYQDLDGAERYRAILRSYSTEAMMVETYPVSDILKRHALTIFLHRHHHTPDHRIGEVLRIMNPGLRGSFTIIYNKLIKSGPRTGSRIISLDASEEFLNSLSKFEKNHRFRLANKKFFISGGIRKDSSPSEPLPVLPSAQITNLLNSNMGLILANANRQVEERQRHMAGRGLHSEEAL